MYTRSPDFAVAIDLLVTSVLFLNIILALYILKVEKLRNVTCLLTFINIKKVFHKRSTKLFPSLAKRKRDLTNSFPRLVLLLQCFLVCFFVFFEMHSFEWNTEKCPVFQIWFNVYCSVKNFLIFSLLLASRQILASFVTQLLQQIRKFLELFLCVHT